MALIRSFRYLGWSTSFSECHENLGLKGVQLETLGAIHVDFACKWLYFGNTSQILGKTSKYLKNNAKDLGDMRTKALTDQNYG